MANEFLTRNEEIVDGIYRLGALIRRSVHSAVYETEFGEDALPAVIKIRQSESSNSEKVEERLRNVTELAHPGLLKIYATGSCVLNDVAVSYVVMERADESLEEVLAERALTESETREMLVPVLAALQYMHKKGYAHGGLRASNVFAVRDQIKLSSDSAIRVDDGGSTEEDMRALELLTLQALTQKTPNAHEKRESYAFAESQQPLADIVRRCLNRDSDGRWTVEQVDSRLKASGVEPVQLNRKPPVDETAKPEEEDPAVTGSRLGVPKWIYAGLAALILVVVLVAVMRKNDSGPVATVPTATAPLQDPHLGATGLRSADGRGSGPASRGATPALPSETTRAISGARGRKADGWAVIVGAYGAREPAEKRMRDLMRRWPRFNISVFEPQTEKHYLVVLGQNLSEVQAEALRKRAVGSGLPGDTYIKRMM